MVLDWWWGHISSWGLFRGSKRCNNDGRSVWTTGETMLKNKPHLWPCITKPTKSRMAQFCVMARNRWSGSAWVIFRFWYILKEQSFFYIILKFGSIKRIISRVFCCFSRPIFLQSDGVEIIALVLLFPYKLDYLAYFEPL